MLTDEMTRHTTFKFCLDPTVNQHEVLARHAGASRFAFNQCVRMVKTALTYRRAAGAVPSFRLRNKHPKDKPPAIRVGEGFRPRLITLPGIGQIGCMTTPAGCGACSPTNGPRSCSPLSLTTRAAGGYR